MFKCCFKQSIEKKTIENHSDHDMIQRTYRNSASSIIRILLLGTGESGKSTLIKQIKISYVRLYTTEEKKSFISDIRHTLHEIVYEIAIYIKRNNLWNQLDENTSHSVNYLLNWGELGPSTYLKEYFDNVFQLWQNAFIQSSKDIFFSSDIIDCGNYFLGRLKDISKPNYVPNDEDILKCRKPTKEIQKISFRMKLPRAYGKLNQEFWMFDVGGQRNERRKWIQTFAGVHAVLFLVATSEFNQTLREDNTQNRLKESLTLFQEVWTSRFLLYSGFILFLNKQDVLRTKIENDVRLEDYFPKFKDWKRQRSHLNNYEQAKTFIREEFMAEH
ncbi:guanine nucleotide-binding protein G(f) subunit alpha-like isoform X2 [Chrysoperla carnea]|uniref:guanine nucleotide-binding protein G(f) subunit alpha-like isoform X2 n=1 Tax=Chrysoperla carnea TaxID=189513 RepID=UPI001D07859C|nr:guanine nucleotide-binding protein G(f) subunit alpha-like isoform X2 [Chrysoperla carnea]